MQPKLANKLTRKKRVRARKRWNKARRDINGTWKEYAKEQTLQTIEFMIAWGKKKNFDKWEPPKN